MAPHYRHITSVAVATALLTVAGCMPPQPDDTTTEATTTPPAAARMELPTVESLETDTTDPDDVAHDLVTILETHDTTTEDNEWTSLSRGVELMEPEYGKAQLQITNGGILTEWETWQEKSAFVVASVRDAEDSPTDDDTAVTAQRRIDAQLTPQLPDGSQLPQMQRTHTVTMTKKDGHWLVTGWEFTDLEKSTTEQAGEKSRSEGTDSSRKGTQ